MATYARGLTSQAVNLTHTTHWSECLMYYVANACSNRNLCNWRVNYQMTPKISLNTRCSISISENLSINGQTRSSDQLGIWSYNINP